MQRFLPEANNPRSLPAASVPYLATLADGSLWIGTKHGVARWTGTDFERVGAGIIPSLLINGLTAESDGSLWISTMAGAMVRRPDGRFEAPSGSCPKASRCWA